MMESKRDLTEKLLKIAEDRSDVQLALVATGYRSASNYLEHLIDPKSTDIGLANVSKTSKTRLRTIINANAKRRDQLILWVRREEKELKEGKGGNEFYLHLYQQELDLLDTYALAALADIITDEEDLKERAKIDEAERAERRRIAMEKKAAKEAASAE